MISVAVPSFNYARFLDACLGSIAAQDHDDFEVLIADGGSTDDSLAVIERFVGHDRRFRLISRSDTGQADAIQKAFAFAEGDVFCFLNADDCYLTDHVLSDVVAAFEAEPDAALVSFGGSYVDAAGAVLRSVNLRYHPCDSLENLPWRSSVLQPATFWRREVQLRFPFRTEFHYCFDALFFWQAWRAFRWIEREPRVAGYRLHGDNKSLQVRPQRVLELARFERIKFGERSLRALWLSALGHFLAASERLPWIGRPIGRAAYLINNGLAFVTFYRWPGI